MSKIYRIFVFGPFASGKSQLSNFIFMKKVFGAGRPQSCSQTVDIFSTKRNGLNLEIIDYVGYTEYKAEENLYRIIDQLKGQKLNSLDLFLLVINPFYVRYPSDTKNYIKLILNTFTPIEFFNHLGIIFTHCYEHPKEKLRKNIDIIVMQLNQIFEELIGIKNNPNIILPKIYEIDTKLDDNEKYIEKYQATIDVLLLNMEKNYEICGEISIKDIKIDGVKERLENEVIKLEESKDENREKKIEELIKKYDICIHSFS